MEIRTGTRPSRWRPLLLYGPLFLIPAAAVFVLVLMQFQGLPPQFESTIVFRLDPHFGSQTAGREEDRPTSRAMLDPRAVTREIKSRYRLREAMKDLEVFRERSEEKQELFLDQTIQALDVKLKREFGENAYLVNVSLTRATHDPKPFEQLLRNIRKTYLYYNVDRLIEQQAKDKGSLDRSLAEYRSDHDDALDRLNAFRQRDENRLFIPPSAGEPPPITKELSRIREKLADLEKNEDDASAQLSKELSKRLAELNELKKNAPAVMRQFSIQKAQVAERLERLENVRQQHAVCGSALAALNTHRDERFAIVHEKDQPDVASRRVESEQTSRLFIGAAAGVVAGLLMVLIALVIGILGNRGE